MPLGSNKWTTNHPQQTNNYNKKKRVSDSSMLHYLTWSFQVQSSQCMLKLCSNAHFSNYFKTWSAHLSFIIPCRGQSRLFQIKVCCDARLATTFTRCMIGDRAMINGVLGRDTDAPMLHLPEGMIDRNEPQVVEITSPWIIDVNFVVIPNSYISSENNVSIESG